MLCTRMATVTALVLHLSPMIIKACAIHDSYTFRNGSMIFGRLVTREVTLSSFVISPCYKFLCTLGLQYISLGSMPMQYHASFHGSRNVISSVGNL